MDDKFKLPQSSYEELTKVIKAYGHFTQEVSLEEVSRLISLHTTIISRNAGFLLATGILTTGAKKAATDIGRMLARALEHEMPDEIRSSWRTVVQENDFLSKVIAAIKIRNGMDQQTLESHIAYSAGQPKKPQFMTGARTVIEILRAAELIREFDGKYVADTSSQAESDRSVAGRDLPLGHETTTARPEPAATAPAYSARIEQSSNYSLTININISCTPADIDGLGAKLRELIDTVKADTDSDAGA